MSSNDVSGWRLHVWRAAVAVPILFMAANLQAEDAKKTGDPGANRLLFDGKSLKDWEITDFGGQGEVEVRDGVLVIGRGEPITGIHWKGDPLPKVNYELTLDAKRIDGNDFFAAVTFPVQDSFCTLVLGGWGGGLIGLSSINGQDASENETTDYFSFEKDRWYKVRIRVSDTRIDAWLDDKQIANVDYSDKKIGVRIEMELSKPLGVATYHTVGGLRNFQLKGLSAERKAQAGQ